MSFAFGPATRSIFGGARPAVPGPAPPPGAAPLILYTDFTAGPVTGMVTNASGESTQGCYLSIFLLNAGNFSDYGTTNHVTIGGVEVGNYRCLTTSIGGTAHVWANLTGVKRLVVQVGALGSPTAGVALPISVTVGGVGPSNATSGGNFLMPTPNATPLTFIPQPGPMIYVDPVGGNNANAGTISAPLKDLQTSAGTGGALHINTSVNATDGTQPGTHIICRAGTSAASGFNSRGVDLFRITGTPATGASSRGPIVVTVYPGPAGGNAPEAFTMACAAGIGGCFNGNDSTRAQETSTSYGGFTGWCQDIHLCNMTLISSATKGTDGGVVNMQSTAQRWRQVNLEYIWMSTVTGANHPKSGGSEGSSVNSVIYNPYAHDIYGDTSFMENHAFYADGNIVVTQNLEIFGFTIENITGGNGIQTYDGVNGAGMTGIQLHNGWIKTCAKNNLNLVDNTKSVKAWNIVMQGAGEHGTRWSSSLVSAANGFYLGNCTIYNWDTTYTAAERDALISENDYSGSGGTGLAENLICMQPASHATNNQGFYSEFFSGTTLRKGRYYDAAGHLTVKPSQDATGSYGDPLMTSPSTGDFSLQAGSACLNAAITPTVITRVYDILMNPCPFGASQDIGAYERQS